MKTYNIAITGFHATCEPTAAQHIAHSLKTSSRFGNSKLIALNYDINCGGNFNPTSIDEVYVLPSPFDNEDRFYHALVNILKKAKIDILIPTMDFELSLFPQFKERLLKEGVDVMIVLPQQYYFHNKQKLYRFCESQKIPMPWTVEVINRYTIDYYSPYFIYPLLLKNSKGQEIFCCTLEEVYVFYRRLLREPASTIYLQNTIGGEFYSACLLFGKSSEILGKIIVKRILVAPNGETWGVLTVTAPPLQAVLDNLLFKLGITYEGPLEIKFKRIIGTDIFYITDLKTQFPTWVHLATKAGQNLVETYLKFILGESVEKLAPYQPGMMLIKSAYDQVSPTNNLGKLIMRGEMTYDKKAA